MKNLLFLCALFLSGGAAIAQSTTPPTQAATPVKKANTIIIQTADSTKEALRLFAGILQDRGYIIDKLDYDLQTVSTRPKAVGKSSALLTLNALYRPEGIVLRGQYHIEALGVAIDSPAEFSGGEGGANKMTFREMEAAAKAYPHTKGLVYEVR